MTDHDQFVTEFELSARLDIPVPTLRTWRCRRTGPPFVKIGPRAVRYSWKAVLEHCERNTITTVEPGA